MNNEVIKILDYMAKQMGMVIDWTSENILPQLIDIFNRYTYFKIAESSIYIICCICIFYLVFYLSKKIYASHKTAKETNESTIFFDCNNYRDVFYITYNGIFIITITVSIILLIIAIFSFIINIYNLLSWIFVPEIQIFELLQTYIR